jgi:hypothetical protein
VKTDDPELERRRQEAIERNEKMDKLTLSILRAHLQAEQTMNEYIVASGFKKKWLYKKRFWDKMQKCKQLAKEEGKDPLWDVLNVANELRNTIAHSLEIAKITEKMARLKEKYLASLTDKQAAGLKDQPDDFIAMSACSTCIGFIATLQSRIGSETSAEATKA